ncbi:MAG: extracellular solute-binding protein [Angelakisella sp.]
MRKCTRVLATAAAIMMTMSVSACGKTNLETDPISASSGSGTQSMPTTASSNLNEAAFPIVNEQITLSVFGQRDANHAEWKDMLVMQEYEKMTNIKLDYQEVPQQGYDEKKNLVFASNELPDIFLRADLKPEEIAMYGVESGQLVPLESYIEQYAPNLSRLLDQYPESRAAMTAADGHIYAIPAFNTSDTGKMAFKQWINKEWLAAVGMQAPTTTAELKEVLIAFRDKDPNKNSQKDEIPLGIREPASIYALGGSFGLQSQMNGEQANIDDGKIHYWLADDNYKKYLQFLNDLYKEKLLWQDYYKNDRPAWRSNLANAQFGMMYMPYSDVFINVEDQFTGLVPLKGPDGFQLWSDAITPHEGNASFALSNTCKAPEAAIRWVDYFYSDEGSVFARYGVEGKTFNYDADGIPQIVPEILNDEKGFMTALGKINMVPGGGAPWVITNKTDGIVASELTKEVAQMHLPYLPEKVYARPPVTQEQQERVNAIRQDLVKYRDEAATKFILGEWGFDKWEEYCKTLEKIGMKELEEIYQQAFDKMYK